jgi:hypothetical protein
MKNLLLVLAVLAMYISVSELSGKQKADEACAAATIDESTDDLLAIGLSLGARAEDSGWRLPRGNTRVLQLTFTGMAKGSDFYCMVQETDGRVSGKKILYSSLFGNRR